MAPYGRFVSGLFGEPISPVSLGQIERSVTLRRGSSAQLAGHDPLALAGPQNNGQWNSAIYDPMQAASLSRHIQHQPSAGRANVSVHGHHALHQRSRLVHSRSGKADTLEPAITSRACFVTGTGTASH